MKRSFLFLIIIIFLFFLSGVTMAQTQTVANGAPTTVVNFSGAGCAYTWTNSNPAIGLASSGTGDIASFTAVNKGSVPVTATIVATPVPTAFAYIANSGDGTVSVINIGTNTVITTIPVGSNPFGASVSQDGDLVYITNKGSNSLSIINTLTNTVIATINVGAGPQGVIVSPDGTRVYVANSLDNTVSVINTSNNSLLITIPVGQDPYGIAITPDGTKLYVTNYSSNTISVINTASVSVTATITGFHRPSGIALSPGGDKLYVSDEGSNNVFTINTADNSIITRTQTLGEPVGLAVSPDGARVYAAIEAGYFTVIFTSDNTTSNIAAGSLTSVSVTPDGLLIYLIGRSITDIDYVSNTNIGKGGHIVVGSHPNSFGNFISKGPGCNSSPSTFTITVNPTAVLPPTITASTATGAISACVGSASANPDIQQFTISGSNLTGNIIAKAPAGFEVSLSPGVGYGTSVTITPTDGTLGNAAIYVRSSSSDPAGNISGNVILTSTGAANQSVAVSGNINASPVVNAVSNQTVPNGTGTTAINFSGTGNTYNWVNNTPGIGLPSSGTGNIAAFTSVNTGTTPITATITITPITAGFAYITNYDDGTVSVVNVVTNKVVSTIKVGSDPVGVSVTPDGSRVYVANPNDGTLSVINTATNTVTATIDVGLGPTGVAVSPDGSKVYVTNELNGIGTIIVINTITNAVTAKIAVDTGPYSILVSPDNSKVYFTTTNNVSVISTATNKVTSTINVGLNPTGLTISPDGSKLYVTNFMSNSVSVINTTTNAILATISVGHNPTGICVNPDGSRVYVANQNGNDNSVSVINATSNSVISTIPVVPFPTGMSITSDGSSVYVTSASSDQASVINTATNKAITTVTVGQGPVSYGNFITHGTSCPGMPLTFTITVTPANAIPPNIVTTPAVGYAATCAGTPSTESYAESFTVSGSNLTGDVVATAPANFEISLNASSGFGNTVTITSLSDGTLPTTNVYIRLAATAPAGKLSGDIILTSPGADNKTVTAKGTVNSLPVMQQVGPQSIVNGSAIAAITFTGTADFYVWTNDKPGIGLPAQGTGNIFSFKGINTGQTPIVANITVTPQSAGTGGLNPTPGCEGNPTTFTITVNPDESPNITITQGPSALTTVYGTPSTSTYFIVSGTNLTSDLLVTPPPGFEVSIDNVNYSNTVIMTTENHIAAGKVYIRLAATTPVGTYSGNITLSSGTTVVDEPMPASTVTKAPLTITADNKSKFYLQPNPALTATYTGFVNNETAAQLTTQPVLSTIATITSPVGKYDIDIDGAESPNYDITQLPGVLTIYPPDIIIPDTFTPNNDGINDTWEINALASYPQCTVSVYTRYGGLVYQSIGYPAPWDGTYKGSMVPTGTYYYIIYSQPDKKPLAGWVAIIR